tara:strand:- start:292 stop:768 length:477 start_codon:yes stop_codon:yes gene_type:complete
LARDESSDLDVFKDFVNSIIKKKKSLPEYIVHLRPTTPVRNDSILSNAIRLFKKKSMYSSLRSVSLMSNPSFKTFRIKNKKLCSIVKNDYSLDKYNLPKELFERTYVPNGYIDIFKTKNILKNFIHGSKVYPFIINELNFDIDDLRDYKKLKKNINEK